MKSKIMKKILAALLAITLFVACNNEGENDDNSNDTTIIKDSIIVHDTIVTDTLLDDMPVH